MSQYDSLLLRTYMEKIGNSTRAFSLSATLNYIALRSVARQPTARWHVGVTTARNFMMDTVPILSPGGVLNAAIWPFTFVYFTSG